MKSADTFHSQMKLGAPNCEWQDIWRDPRLWVVAWAIYALCVLAWLGYSSALSGFMCGTAQ